jgi:ribosome-associated protein
VAARKFEAPWNAGQKEDDDESLRSRSDARREQKQTEESLMRLAWALVELPRKTLDKLELPESLLDVIEKARRVPDGGPKNRALRLVRIMLRDGDATKIEEDLREVHDPARRSAAKTANTATGSAAGGASAGSARSAELSAWRTRLVEGDEGAITAYVEAFPDADRRNLRQLVRNARKATDATRAGALAALTKALQQTLSARPRDTAAD